jgi:hypothetical protein
MMDAAQSWQILGIAPTPDEREVKRAYAKLLKTMRPEDDPDAFQRLREAFEAALWAADELRSAPPAEPAAQPERTPREIELENAFRPHIERLAELNEKGTSDEALAALEEMMARFDLHHAKQGDPLAWQLFEDGMLWICCDIAANHDEFLRAGMNMFGWIEPGSWLAEKDPKTVEWLKLRMREADALDAVDKLFDLVDAGDDAGAVRMLDTLVNDEMLINVDVRHLFEAELMVGLSEFEPIPSLLSQRAIELFGWTRDHRHLEDYHPDAWETFCKKAGLGSYRGWRR